VSPGIEVDGVTHRLGGRVVLDDVTVRLDEARVGVIGANGSGKSTFARLLNGLVVPDTGTVRVAGRDTASDGAAVRRTVGFVFTNPDAQVVMPTVAEDVALSLRRHRLDRVEVDARVQEALAQVGLVGFDDRPSHLLSGGEKQLLALAGVLVARPQVLVCDEPTTLLDLPNTRRVMRILLGLSQQLVMVTHDLDTLDDVDRVLVFQQGRIVADAAPGEAIDSYRALVG
jgi:biotin transport system ATP-binding protein